MAYKLYIKKNTKDNSPVFSIQVNELVTKYKDDDGNDKDDISFSIVSLKYDKGIYRPCCIEAQFLVTLKGSDGNNAPFDSIKNVFLKKFVDLSYIITVAHEGSLKTKEYTIAKNYFVFDVIPEFRNSNMKSVYVTLMIYSPDKFLTLDKYCKTYVAQKLGTDIFKNFMAKKDTQTEEVHKNLFNEKGCKSNFEITNLQNLRYEPKDASLGNTQELILPYLVQYNESFYDLMARTANRYGEFFFYEDGELILGLKKTDNPTDIKKFSSITYHGSYRGEKRDSDFAWRRNYDNEKKAKENEGKDGVQYSDKGECYNYEGLAFEYLEHTGRRVGATGWEAEALLPNKIFTNNISTALGKNTVSEMLIAAGLGISFEMTRAALLAKSNNKTYNEKHVDVITCTEQMHLNDKGKVTTEGATTKTITTKGDITIATKGGDATTKITKEDGTTYTQSGDITITTTGGTTTIASTTGGTTTQDRSTSGDTITTTITTKGTADETTTITITNQGGKIAIKGDTTSVKSVAITTKGGTTTTSFTDKNKDATTIDTQGDTTTQDGGKTDEVSRFSSFDGKEIMTITYFSHIEKYEHEAEEGGIHIKFKNFDECKELMLGKQIKVNGKFYIVTSITGSMLPSGGDFSSGYTESVEMDAVLYEETKEINGEKKNVNPYPFPLPEGTIRKCSPQIAYIADNNDPMRIGRVRIRYPWQKKGDTASPWIRMSRPMATKGGGIDFIPSEGDEVLVDYENGNIERPFVVGSVHSYNREPAGTSLKGTHHTITSVNGHTIHFSDPGSGQGFFNGLLPFMGVVKSYFPDLKYRKPFDFVENVKELTGGIDMCDTYGMYSLSLSSDKRTVDIKSPWGNVSINAFTGITLNAPNGDIKIVGKNVTIQAGNDLKLVSGMNIKNGYRSAYNNEDSAGKTLKKIGISLGKGVLDTFVAKGIDFKLYRTFIETVLRPVGGTLLVKSHRYLQLEAGKGEVKKPLDYYDEKKLTKIEKSKSVNELNIKKISFANNVINKSNVFIGNYLREYKRLFHRLQTEVSNYNLSKNKEGLHIGDFPTSDDLVEAAINGQEYDQDKFERVITPLRNATQNASLSPEDVQLATSQLNYVTDVKSKADSLHSNVKDTRRQLQNAWNSPVDFGNINNDILGSLRLNVQDLNSFITIAKDKIKTEEINKFSLDNIEQFNEGIAASDASLLVTRRHFLFLVLKELKNKEILNLDVKGNGSDVYNDSEKWSKFVNKKIGVFEDPISGFDKFSKSIGGDYLFERFGFKGFNDDWRVCSVVQKGEILFSDKDGVRTISFGDEGNSLTSQVNENEKPALENLKAQLNDLINNN